MATIPWKLAPQTIPVFGAMAKAAAKTLLPITRNRQVPSADKVIVQEVLPPSDALIDAYMAWSGASLSRYGNTLPPHFCSHWALSLLAQLGGETPYDVRRVLNQGLRLQVNAPISRGETIYLKGHLADVSHELNRIRLHSHVEASTPQHSQAIVLDSFTAIPLANRANKSTRQESTVIYDTIGQWSAHRQDGLHFALITGDFNPIHTSWFVARRSPFRSCILQGFGFLARTYEMLENNGIAIADMDVRFVKPLILPTPLLQVQIARAMDEEGRLPFRLCSPDGSIHLAGSLIRRL